MILSTTPTLEGHEITKYQGLVTCAGIRDILGGRSGSYEKVLRRARQEAIEDMLDQARGLGANAVVGVDLDYETIQVQDGGSMLMVSVSGTAVTIEAR